MKKIILPILVLAMVSFELSTNTITETERKAAIENMEQTRDRLHNTIEGLSETQLNYKASATSWSVAECLEHLATSEIIFNQLLQTALKVAADPSRRPAVKMSDERLMNFVTDRTNKVQTSKAFEPTGKFGSHKESLKAFNEQREAHITYMKSTQDDLRNHYSELPFGVIDGYQILWFMSGHTERHVQQMEEVMQDVGFPLQ